MNAAKRFIDLSHTIKDGMITYPGLPGPRISAHMSYADSRPHYDPGTEFHIGKIELVANTGTYLDSPFHRFPGGDDLSRLPLASLAELDGIVVRADHRQGRVIGPEAFGNQQLAGKAVLVHTGWSAYFGSEGYFSGHPFLTREAVQRLHEAGPALVGIDSLNIDDTADGSRPAHTLLLGAAIPVVEHLTNLEQLPDSGFRFFAVPVKVEGLGSFPVRAFAILNG